MFKLRFREPILAGTKRQTIREPRRHPPRIGERISLRVWEGRPYASPQVILGTATFLAEIPVDIDWNPEEGLGVILDSVTLDAEQLDDFARCDGFADAKEMDLFWQKNKGYPFVGSVYAWGDFKPAEEGGPS